VRRAASPDMKDAFRAREMQIVSVRDITVLFFCASYSEAVSDNPPAALIRLGQRVKCRVVTKASVTPWGHYHDVGHRTRSRNGICSLVYEGGSQANSLRSVGDHGGARPSMGRMHSTRQARHGRAIPSYESDNPSERSSLSNDTR